MTLSPAASMITVVPPEIVPPGTLSVLVDARPGISVSAATSSAMRSVKLTPPVRPFAGNGSVLKVVFDAPLLQDTAVPAH